MRSVSVIGNTLSLRFARLVSDRIKGVRLARLAPPHTLKAFQRLGHLLFLQLLTQVRELTAVRFCISVIRKGMVALMNAKHTA